MQEQLLNKSQLNKARWNASVVQKEVAKDATKATTAMQSGTDGYNKLLEDLRGVARQIANKSKVSTNHSAELQVLFDEKKEILSLINREGTVVEQKLAEQISALEEQNNVIDQNIINLKQEIKDWSGVTQDYLAKTAAIIGKRVLLVDTDMRSNGRISTSTPLANSFGLTGLVLKPNLNLRLA